jgi:hypothetical protein
MIAEDGVGVVALLNRLRAACGQRRAIFGNQRIEVGRHQIF